VQMNTYPTPFLSGVYEIYECWEKGLEGRARARERRLPALFPTPLPSL